MVFVRRRKENKIMLFSHTFLVFCESLRLGCTNHSLRDVTLLAQTGFWSEYRYSCYRGAVPTSTRLGPIGIDPGPVYRLDYYRRQLIIDWTCCDTPTRKSAMPSVSFECRHSSKSFVTNTKRKCTHCPAALENLVKAVVSVRKRQNEVKEQLRIVDKI